MLNVDDDQIDLGPCCRCGERGDTVRKVVALPEKAPVPGTGWGCVVCGLPADGALAVLCDACIDDDRIEIDYVCYGYPANGERIGIMEIESDRFEHDLSKHIEDEAGEIL